MQIIFPSRNTKIPQRKGVTAYSPELREAEKQQCRYSVNVSYQRDVTTSDFVFALQRLRSKFYVQLP